MYCKKCGKELVANSNFCRNCGTPVGVKTKRKTYRIFFALAIIYIFMIPTSAKSSIVAVLINLAFIAGFAYLGVKKYRASKTQESPVRPADIEPSKAGQTFAKTTIVSDPNESIPDVGKAAQETTKSLPFDTKDHVLDYTFQSYQVAGVSHYKKNIMEVAYENDDYSMTKKQIVDAGMEDEKIWKYEISPLTAVLVPEPDNEHSKNAIQVVIDGLLVGYIPERKCLHLLEVMEEDRIMDITAEICGGPYKVVTYDGVDYSTGKDIYSIEKGEHAFSIELTIKEKKKITV